MRFEIRENQTARLTTCLVERRENQTVRLTTCLVAACLMVVALFAGASGAYGASDGLVAAHAGDAWDGVTLTEPTKSSGAYQIGTGAELAWFAAQVNDGAGASYRAVLTGDIDLGGKSWAPIGTSSSKSYKGQFDGKGNEVLGLHVENSNAQAGLFGYVSGAAIRNVIVSGQVKAENNAAGGLVSRADGITQIQNCGNLANVTNTASSGRAAGIVGWAYEAATITGCFNRGEISAGDRASGIVADTGMGTTVSNCYNTGAISAAKANGIGGSTGISYTNCYNAGLLTGTSTAYAIGASGYAEYENTYFLEGTAANAVSVTPAPVALAASDMKKPNFVTTLGSANWQVDVGAAVNGGFPLLSWEQAASVQAQKLATPANLVWLDQEPPGIDGVDIAYEVMQVAWNAVDGAQGYRVKLYRADDLEHALFVSDPVEDTVYDLFGAFAALGATDCSRYVFTVTALGDGTYYLDSDESAVDGAGFEFDGAAFVPAPAQTIWNEASKIAVWSRVPDVDFYIVSLYRGAVKVAEYNLDKGLLGTSSPTLSLQFISNMTGAGDYYFTVRAGKQIADGPNVGKRAASALAISDTTHYEATVGETVEIASADDWMRIVNLTHEGTNYVTDADAQNVEWSKNYVITADLDFSDLSAEQQVQTKSWGNVDAHFNGTLDGQGHKITGLTLANGDNGLFTYIGTRGVVKNLTVESANVLFNDNAGIFCQYNYGTITSCGVKNTNISSDYSGVIAGFMARNFGLVQDSYVQGGTIVTTTETANGHAGFVGNNSGTIRRCWTSMDVSTESYCAGGFCGWADERYNTETGEYNGGTFENCFALGSVDAKWGWNGGFVGRVNSSRTVFKNCYAAGAVASTQKPGRAHGFFGSMGGEGARDIHGEDASSFYITLPAENCANCFYCTDSAVQDNACNLTQGKSLAEMQTDEFAEALGLDWVRADGENGGLPYLRDMAIPQAAERYPITVHLAVALYNTDEYAFEQEGETVDVTFETAGNPRVIDVMRAAADQGLLSYEYTVTPAYGSFIESINGHALSSPDGWMFTVNDDLSDVGVQLASVRDGDQLLWFQGMPANLFLPPAWQDVTGEEPKVEWVDIETADDLVALTRPGADMAGSYRLARNIDLAGVDFAGIGSATAPFAGVFKGKGFAISNLTINQPDDHNVGLFNFVRGAEISGVTVNNANVTGGYSVGVLVGVAAVQIDKTDRAKCIGNLIGNCRVSGKVASANADTSATSDGAYAGGLVGFNDGDKDDKTGISVYSSIDRCQADVAVSAHTMYAGGLVGGNYGIVTNCIATGAVSGGDCTGGLFGGNVGSVYDSGATGTVTGASRTGGFGGDNYNDAVERCYSTGNVCGSGERIGGFLGDSGGTVKHCLSAGAVRASSHDGYVGGFAGYYTGALSGLYVRITFEDNGGWSVPDGGEGALPALGNKKSSTVEAEQAVLDSTQVVDWAALQQMFDERFGVQLADGGPAPWADGSDDPGVDDPVNPGNADPASQSADAITPTDAAALAAKETAKLAKPDAKKLQTLVKPNTNSTAVKIAAVKGAVNYCVAYRKADAKAWSYIWTAGKSSVTLSKLAHGGMYEYQVAAFAKDGGTWVRSAWSNPTYCWLTGTSVMLKAKKKSAKVTIKRVAKASGYELRWSKKKSMANAKVKKLKAKKTKVTIKKLKRKKKTYVQVVPYRTYNGKVYVGAASPKKAVRAK